MLSGSLLRPVAPLLSRDSRDSPLARRSRSRSLSRTPPTLRPSQTMCRLEGRSRQPLLPPLPRPRLLPRRKPPQPLRRHSPRRRRRRHRPGRRASASSLVLSRGKQPQTPAFPLTVRHHHTHQRALPFFASSHRNSPLHTMLFTSVLFCAPLGPRTLRPFASDPPLWKKKTCSLPIKQGSPAPGQTGASSAPTCRRLSLGACRPLAPRPAPLRRSRRRLRRSTRSSWVRLRLPGRRQRAPAALKAASGASDRQLRLLVSILSTTLHLRGGSLVHQGHPQTVSFFLICGTVSRLKYPGPFSYLIAHPLLTPRAPVRSTHSPRPH